MVKTNRKKTAGPTKLPRGTAPGPCSDVETGPDSGGGSSVEKVAVGLRSGRQAEREPNAKKGRGVPTIAGATGSGAGNGGVALDGFESRRNSSSSWINFAERAAAEAASAGDSEPAAQRMMTRPRDNREADRGRMRAGREEGTADAGVKAWRDILSSSQSLNVLRLTDGSIAPLR